MLISSSQGKLLYIQEINTSWCAIFIRRWKGGWFLTTVVVCILINISNLLVVQVIPWLSSTNSFCLDNAICFWWDDCLLQIVSVLFWSGYPILTRFCLLRLVFCPDKTMILTWWFSTTNSFLSWQGYVILTRWLFATDSFCSEKVIWFWWDDCLLQIVSVSIMLFGSNEMTVCYK